MGRTKRIGRRAEAIAQPIPGDQDKPAQTEPEQGPTPAPDRADDRQSEAIRKGIYLSALVYIEGMQAPAEDFAALARSALAEALQGEHNGLTVTLKNSHVENNVEDASEDASEDKPGKGGFEF